MFRIIFPFFKYFVIYHTLAGNTRKKPSPLRNTGNKIVRFFGDFPALISEG